MRRNTHALLSVLVLLSALWGSGCSDGRPDERQVAAELSRRYPGVDLLSVRTSEDEVTAKSFEFSYRYQAEDSPIRFATVQYMMREDGVWEPRPPLPAVLDR